MRFEMDKIPDNLLDKISLAEEAVLKAVPDFDPGTCGGKRWRIAPMTEREYICLLDVLTSYRTQEWWKQ